MVAAALVSPAPAPAASGRPDLKVSAATGKATSVSRGAGLELTVTVANIGRAPAMPTLVKVFLVKGPKVAKSDTELDGTGESPRLKPKAKAKLKLKLLVPATAPLGPRNLIACADPDKSLKEAAEGNQCKLARKMTVLPAALSGPAPVTSEALIEGALAKGNLKPEAAVLDSVYAAFGDPRLPARFRGFPAAGDSHDLALAAVTARWKTLSKATRKLLAPFLMRPSSPGSWWQLRYGAGGPRRGVVRRAATQCQGAQHGWSYVDSPRARVRVWYQDRYESTDHLLADRLRREIETTIQPRLSAVMGVQFKDDRQGDNGDACDGGNAFLDVSLVDQASRGQTQSASCAGASSSVTLDRNGPDPKNTAAHELMHVLQYVRPIKDCSVAGAFWWLDAAADWAKHLAYPTDDVEHERQPLYFASAERPFDTNDTQRRYGANLFPLFLDLSGDRDAIRRISVAAETKSWVEAVDEGAPGGLRATWPRFAEEMALNVLFARDRITERAWGTLPDGSNTSGIPIDMGLNGGMQRYYELPVSIQHFAMRVFRFDVSDPHIRMIGLRIPALDDPRADVQLFGKDGSTWSRIDRPKEYLYLCHQQPGQRYDELDLVYSYSSIDPAKIFTSPPDELPQVLTTNIGCRYNGQQNTSNVEGSAGGDTLDERSGATVEYQADGPLSSADGRISIPAVRGDWTYGYSRKVTDCTTSASGSGSIPDTSSGSIALQPLTQRGPSREYTVGGGIDKMLTYHQVGTSASCNGDYNAFPVVGWGFFSQTGLHVKAHGEMAEDLRHPGSDGLRTSYSYSPF